MGDTLFVVCCSEGGREGERKVYKNLRDMEMECFFYVFHLCARVKMMDCCEVLLRCASVINRPNAYHRVKLGNPKSVNGLEVLTT
jgi:hypothetical protein